VSESLLELAEKYAEAKTRLSEAEKRFDRLSAFMRSLNTRTGHIPIRERPDEGNCYEVHFDAFMDGMPQPVRVEDVTELNSLVPGLITIIDRSECAQLSCVSARRIYGVPTSPKVQEVLDRARARMAARWDGSSHVQ
jgi:hypothetical protein